MGQRGAILSDEVAVAQTAMEFVPGLVGLKPLGAFDLFFEVL